LFPLRGRFAPFAFRMVGVARAEETPTSGCCLVKHSIASRIRRTVGNTMLDDMNVDAASKRLKESFLFCTIHDLLHGEVWLFRVFTMEQSSGDPHLVGDLDTNLGECSIHVSPL